MDHLTETFPKSFDRIVWGPHAGNSGAIDFQVAAGEGSIGDVCKWAIMSMMETLVNPKVSLSSATRYNQSTTSKICFLISSLSIVAIVSSLRMASLA